MAVPLIDIDYFRRAPYGLKGADNLPAEIVEEFIQEASDYVRDYLDHDVTVGTYAERKIGSGNFKLILDKMPIISLIDISYEGYESDVGTHPLSDFLIHKEAGIVEWANKRYYFRPDRIYVVQYTAGYVEVPGPIKRATALQTVQLMRPMYGGAGPEVEVVPFAEDLIVSLLERYRRKRLS